MAQLGAAQVGAVVLAGGRSSRMGSAKAGLEWHGSTLLRRITGLVARAVDGPVVVVRAPGQPLPELPAGVEVVDDPEEGRGPLQGIAEGLAAVDGRAQAAFVCATDLPFLHPVFVRLVCDALADADIALPVVGGVPQPLAAGYRTSLAKRAADLLAQGQSRPRLLLQEAAVAELDEQTLLADARLRQVDPTLDSVVGVNEPQSYEQARARPAPEVVVQRVGALSGTSTVRAATLGAAARAVGLVLDRHVQVAVDGDQIARDQQAPLAQGDVVTFLAEHGRAEVVR